MKRALLGTTLLLFVASCGRSGDAARSPSSVMAPGAHVLAALQELGRDCFQYPTERRPDGSELWNADYVYFYLVREKDGAVAVDDHGAPLASGLLRSEVMTWMEGKQPIAGTAWTWRVKRCVQVIDHGRVLRQSPFTTVDNADLEDLLRKDHLAHAA